MGNVKDGDLSWFLCTLPGAKGGQDRDGTKKKTLKRAAALGEFQEQRKASKKRLY